MEAKQIPGYSNYFISKDGQVTNSRGLRLSTHDSNGYRNIGLIRDKDGKRIGHGVHRLVALTWIGPISEGMWVNHENGNKSDNRVENLRIDTPSYNHKHAFDVLGRKAGNANPLRAKAMQILFEHGMSQHQIAQAFECSQPNVSTMLKRNKSS